ncbi:MAG: acyltransferase [Candidatus Sedimenticola sp. 6PFRAG7]
MDALDGLRGFAALIVVFSHTSNTGMLFIPFLDLQGIGKSGVFLFFLLSSFLLTLPLLHKGKEIFTLSVMSHYWQRRFFRIYPLYTLYLLLGVLSTWLIASQLGQVGLGVPFALDWSGFLNHMLLQEGKGLTWSIVVEFKFYFVLPILALMVVYVRSYGMWITLLFFLVLLVISQIISPQGESFDNDARLLPYMPIFLIGMLLATIQYYINAISNRRQQLARVFRYLGYIGVIGILIMTPAVFSLFSGEIERQYFHKDFILYALLWSCVLMSAVNAPGYVQSFFSLPALRFYGALSFSLYLFHPIFISVFKRLELDGHLTAWLVLAASTISAYISFRLLEGPVSKFKITRKSLWSLFGRTRREI